MFQNFHGTGRLASESLGCFSGPLRASKLALWSLDSGPDIPFEILEASHPFLVPLPSSSTDGTSKGAASA